jgi:hypothetical protein
MALANITAERVRAVFRYDETTGLLWSRRMNRVRPIGSIEQDGYLRTAIDGTSVYVHGVVWLYVTGLHPIRMIDHIDGVKTNNRFSNLREADQYENQHNRWKPANVPNRTSRFIGVSQDKGKPGWRVKIQVRGMKMNLGTFATESMAHEAYMEAKRALHLFAFKDQLEAVGLR